MKEVRDKPGEGSSGLLLLILGGLWGQMHDVSVLFLVARSANQLRIRLGPSVCATSGAENCCTSTDSAAKPQRRVTEHPKWSKGKPCRTSRLTIEPLIAGVPRLRARMFSQG